MMNKHTQRPRSFGAIAAAGSLLGLVALAGCSPDRILGEARPPQGYVDPDIARTREGARAAYHATLAEFRQAFAGDPSPDVNRGPFVLASGLLTDELLPNHGFSFGADANSHRGTDLDRRALPELIEETPRYSEALHVSAYSNLQRVRGQARESMGLLEHYAPDLPSAMRGHLMAVGGYAEIFLADLYCSGIPLSTVDHDGNYTLAAGSSTAEVYEHSIALLDSAMVLAADSARIMNMARVGKGRALLALGRYADAAAAVAEVPDRYRYEFRYLNGAIAENRSAFNMVRWTVSVADRDGMSGLDFISSGDPRTASTNYSRTAPGQALYFPDKYATSIVGQTVTARDDSTVVLGSGVEARLIQAEARLQSGDVAGWLGALNQLRRTAISPALPDLEDPGTTDGRVDLLFRERAAWLFLTGHRQGDLRRLIRHYGRDQADSYPSGVYLAASTGSYGGDVDVPIPVAERKSNPRFTGCIERGA